MLLPVGASALCLLVCLPMFINLKKSLRRVLAAVFKSLGTGCALIMALVAAVRLDSGCWICVIALAFQAAGDFALEFTFPVGMVLFLAGHICYISYFVRTMSFGTPVLICIAGLLITAGLMLYQWRKNIDKHMRLFIIYGIILASMSGIAIGGGMACISLSGVLTALGGALFYVSDCLLLRNMLFPSGRLLPWIIMITYYISQLAIGMSCLF